jgi:alkylation response protein AidB-like acyl-CoA dehydrogenase
MRFGSEEQKEFFLPKILNGEIHFCIGYSEPNAGTDLASLRTRAVRDGDDYVVTGTKAWITHGGVADFYNLMVRTGGQGAKGISCLVTSAATPGMSFATPEHKMGMMASPTAQVVLDGARVPAEDLVGAPGDGFRIAMQALDAGRLGIAACAVGLARAALDEAARYARERQAFGQSIAAFQGVQFMLADMDTQVHAARALLLEAARLKDAGRPFTLPAARAKLLATDVAMRVTTDAVQVLGGAGYTTDFPVERYMREAKVLQIVEGTNQIQRLVLGRALARG